jgi:hypothetical protein
MSATTPPVASSKVDLFEYTEEQLLEEKVLTHYEILGISTFCSQDGTFYRITLWIGVTLGVPSEGFTGRSPRLTSSVPTPC